MLLSLLDGSSFLVILAALFFLALSEKFLKSSFSIISDTILHVGAVFTLVGVIGVSVTLEDPNRLGPAMSIAFLCFAYAIVIKTLVTSNNLEYEEPNENFFLRGVSTFGFLALVVFSMIRVGPLGMFYDTRIAVIVIILIISLYIIASIGKQKQGAFIFKRLPLLGFFLVLVSILLILGNLQNPKEIGSAIGFGLLGLLYTLLLSIIVRILIPRIVLESEETSKVATLTFAIPFLLSVLGIFFALLYIV